MIEYNKNRLHFCIKMGEQLMSISEKDLKRLLELKKDQETLQVLDKAQALEKMKLENRYREYLDMNSKDMEQILEEKTAPQVVELKSGTLSPILEDYKKLYSKESWYKEPEVRGDTTHLTFSSVEAAAEFFTEQAKKERAFLVVDVMTKKVLAYSNGDGKLYNGNGSEYTKGSFHPSEEDYEAFKTSTHGMKP